MKSVFAIAFAAALTAASGAHAQVASASPQGSDPAGSPATQQPLTKPNNNGVPVPHNRQVAAARMPKLVTESDAAFIAEQRRDDRGMNICIGCD